MPLAARVQTFASRHGLWSPDTRVVAAVSGGSDSVALALVLSALGRDGRFHLAGLAHLHHHIRGADADLDAAFVQELADRLNVPCEIGHADVPGLARDQRESLEVAGRRARLDFLERARLALGAERVALAHTRGDQAETVLLRLARGAGPRGLGGMAAATGRRIRPLLDIGREELRAWLVARGETWREDPTNADLAVARNRLRHQVLPVLAAVNPRAEEALARSARILAADADLLHELARRAASHVVARDSGRVHLDLHELARLPEAIARRVVLHALETLDPGRAYGWEDTDAVLRGTGAGRDLGRVRLERNREKAVLFIKAPPEATAVARGEGPWILPIPGMTRHPSGYWRLETAGPMAPELAPVPSPSCAVFDADALGRHLTVRSWRVGDRVQPLGMRGRKKLQDVFVDRKVPRALRATVPVVVDGLERIVWVAGHVVGEPFRVTPHSVAVVVLTLRR